LVVCAEQPDIDDAFGHRNRHIRRVNTFPARAHRRPDDAVERRKHVAPPGERIGAQLPDFTEEPEDGPNVAQSQAL
jgi:hypothetical protein